MDSETNSISQPQLVVEIDDRRDALRLPVRDLIFEVEHARLGRHHATLVDISRTGVRFRCATQLPCGDVLKLHPPIDGLTACRVRLVRQVMVGKGEGETIEYGAHYYDLGDEDRHTWYLKVRRAM